MNRLKNRVDSATFVELSFDSLLRLRWPPHVEGRRRAGWTARDRAAVATREGAPVAVVGYLAGAKASGPESTNCHGADARMRDYHLWVTAAAGEPRARSVVVEMTPRLRAVHPSWRLRRLGRLVRDSARVRVSGWLMLDPEHPDQIGKTRGTIWEIHPVMNFEVERGGRWLPLDSVRR